MAACNVHLPAKTGMCAGTCKEGCMFLAVTMISHVDSNLIQI